MISKNHSPLRQLLLVFILFSPIFSLAQAKIELMPIIGYGFGGRYDSWDARANFSNDLAYGGSLNLVIGEGLAGEFTYFRQKGTVDVNYNSRFTKTEIVTEYYLVGANRLFGVGRVIPFAGLQIGAAVVKPQELDWDNQASFAMAIRGGVKVMPTERFGIVLGGRFLMPIMGVGASFWCGTGGCGTGVTGYAPLLQGDLHGGVVLSV